MNRGQEQTISIGGKNYRLSKATLKVLQDFAHWVNRQLPDPLEEIKDILPTVAPETQKYLIERAEEKREQRRQIDSPDVDSFLRTIEGIVEVVALLLVKHQPSLTREQLRALVWEAVEEHGHDRLFEWLTVSQGLPYREEPEAAQEALSQMGKWPDDYAKKKQA